VIRVRLSIEGAEEAVRDLEKIAERIDRPLRPLLEILGAEAATTFQRNIAERKVVIPELHPVTEAIRRYYGHSAKAPLVRGGDLVRSISTLAYGDDFVDIGSALGFAKTLHDGGTVTDKRGRTHTVPPFQFLNPTEELADDIAALTQDYFLPDETMGASA
jgi:phage gpG-like protein